MERLGFRELPWAVRISTGLAIGLTWVFLEEHVIEPFKWYRYMPFYKIGDFCVYDFTAGLIIVGCIWYCSRRTAPPKAIGALRR
jgi:hypothetical protein